MRMTPIFSGIDSVVNTSKLHASHFSRSESIKIGHVELSQTERS